MGGGKRVKKNSRQLGQTLNSVDLDEQETKQLEISELTKHSINCPLSLTRVVNFYYVCLPTSKMSCLVVVLLLSAVCLVSAGPAVLDLIHKRSVVDADAKIQMAKAGQEYYFKMNSYGCRVPQPRVVSVQQEHPNPSMHYMTSCVLLHRCAADSGCCHESQICSFKDTKDVEIPILVAEPSTGKVTTQMFTFTNHTSCHCLSQKALAARA